MGSETIEELKIERRPTVKDLRNMGGGSELDQGLKLLERMTAQPPTVIDRVDLEDLPEILEVVANFLPDSLTAGGGKAEISLT
jgi:hypothetical protein